MVRNIKALGDWKEMWEIKVLHVEVPCLL